MPSNQLAETTSKIHTSPSIKQKSKKYINGDFLIISKVFMLFITAY